MWARELLFPSSHNIIIVWLDAVQDITSFNLFRRLSHRTAFLICRHAPSGSTFFISSQSYCRSAAMDKLCQPALGRKVLAPPTTRMLISKLDFRDFDIASARAHHYASGAHLYATLAQFPWRKGVVCRKDRRHHEMEWHPATAQMPQCGVKSAQFRPHDLP